MEGANSKFPILQIPVVFSLPAAVDFSGSSTNCCLHSSNSGGIQWGRQGRECLFHLVQSQNPSPRVAVDCQKKGEIYPKPNSEANDVSVIMAHGEEVWREEMSEAWKVREVEDRSSGAPGLPSRGGFVGLGNLRLEGAHHLVAA